MPREILFKIFTSDKELLKDFTIMLLLDSYNPTRREAATYVTNTSAWRLLIKYNKENRIGEILVDPGEKVVLDVRPDEISYLTAAMYGEKWGRLQSEPITLSDELQAEVIKAPAGDVDVVIDGGQGLLRQFTRPFRVRCLSYNVAEYAPVSLVPESRLLLDAFPCVKHKVVHKEPIEVRYFLQLPSNYSPEALTIAYERLSNAWKKERKLKSGNEAYIDRVLQVCRAAYECLTKQVPFPEFQLNETVAVIDMLEPQDSCTWLIKRFFNRQMLTCDAVRSFFTKFCIEQQLQYVKMCDYERKTAYEIALKNHHDKLAQLLHFAHIAENFGEPLRQQLEVCFSLKTRDKIEHEPDKLLTRIVLERLQILSGVDSGLRALSSGIHITKDIAKTAGAMAIDASAKAGETVARVGAFGLDVVGEAATGTVRNAGPLIVKTGAYTVMGVGYVAMGVVVIGTTPITVPLYIYLVMSGKLLQFIMW